MAPAIEPGFGIGVAEGARVNVFVAVDPMVGVIVGEVAIVWVLVSCPRVGEESDSKVGEDNGAGCADCVKTAKVKTTSVATPSGLIGPGVATLGKLQALRHKVKRTETIFTNSLFIDGNPLEEK